MLATVLSLSLLAAVNAAPTKRWYELEPNPSGGVFDNKPSYKYASDFDMAAFVSVHCLVWLSPSASPCIL